jgi:hypothetical protein
LPQRSSQLWFIYLGEPEPEEQPGITYIQRQIIDAPERAPLEVPTVVEDEPEIEVKTRRSTPRERPTPLEYPKVGVA